MNSTSSRSHAIFTVTVSVDATGGVASAGKSTTAKLHFVDLAGSERAKRTGPSPFPPYTYNVDRPL